MPIVVFLFIGNIIRTSSEVSIMLLNKACTLATLDCAIAGPPTNWKFTMKTTMQTYNANFENIVSILSWIIGIWFLLCAVWRIYLACFLFIPWDCLSWTLLFTYFSSSLASTLAFFGAVFLVQHAFAPSFPRVFSVYQVAFFLHSSIFTTSSKIHARFACAWDWDWLGVDAWDWFVCWFYVGLKEETY